MKNLNKKLKTGLYIVLVVAIGLFAVNQAIEWNYNAQMLNGPCSLCAEQNPDQKECVTECFTNKGSTHNKIDYNSITKEYENN